MNKYVIEFEKQYNALIDAVPEDLKILVKGQMDIILSYYEKAALSVLADMYYALPRNDEDWMSDELLEAKEAASKLV